MGVKVEEALAGETDVVVDATYTGDAEITRKATRRTCCASSAEKKGTTFKNAHWERKNVNEVKEGTTEIALTISKVPSEEGTTACATCVEYDNENCSDEVHCTEDSEGGIELQRRAYVKFYDSDDEDVEEFNVEEEEED